MAKDQLTEFTEEELYQTTKPATKAPAEKPAEGTAVNKTIPPNQVSAIALLTPTEVKALSFYQENRTVILTLGIITVVCVGIYLYREHEKKKKRTLPSTPPGRA
ncbi:MAG: hypothetical protein WKF91_11590 [Segetibacter sp.]